MEDVLNVYSSPQEQGVARLCIDERPCQLLDDVLTPVPMQPGRSKRIDYEYKRQGTCTVFMAYDIDKGKRYAQVREHRTKRDYAEFMEWMMKHHYSQAKKVVVVQDNLNTHKKGSLYEHLPTQRAGELAGLLDFHFTPKHGSWLNMAEIEFSALSRQCLKRRIGSIKKLNHEVKAWVKNRNKEKVKINWSFTVSKARHTMASQYRKVNQNN